jgi:anti-anti-sigma regulatory factor
MRTRTAKRRRNRTALDGAAAKRPALCVTLSSDDADAAALKRRLESAVNKGRPIEVDAGALAGLTTAGVQVLLAAAADVEARHAQFRLTGCGPSITDAFSELGLADRIARLTAPEAEA